MPVNSIKNLRSESLTRSGQPSPHGGFIPRSTIMNRMTSSIVTQPVGRCAFQRLTKIEIEPSIGCVDRDCDGLALSKREDHPGIVEHCR